MAMALLPIFVLSLIQTQADFQRQADDRQVDLQLAAERSASSAKAKLDSAQVLLRALSCCCSSACGKPYPALPNSTAG